MGTVGLRELRQDASDLVRRAEAGEEITITVSGRPSARLVPADRRRWCFWSQIADPFAGPENAEWGAPRGLVDDEPRDPWRLRRLSCPATPLRRLADRRCCRRQLWTTRFRVARAGRQPRRRVMDLLIAARAHAHSARLYTREPDDFQGLEDLVEIVSF